MNTLTKIALSIVIVAAFFWFVLWKSPDAQTDLPPRPAGELNMFDAWREIHGALKASPDHLPAQAERLVEAGNAEDIYEFVRDEIRVYLPQNDGFGNATAAMRWGVRATLRGGAGTPREVAELLVQLYQDAGFEAAVVQGAPRDDFDVADLITDFPAREFKPAIRSGDAARWSAALGEISDSGLQFVDPERSQANLLTDRIIAALPDGAETEAVFDMTPPGRIPLVRVIVDGETRYANPLIKNGRFGESYTTDTPGPVGAPYPATAIEVTLQGARSDKPFERFTLAENQWSADQVAGRNIEVRFVPPVDPRDLPYLKASDIETVIPVIRVLDNELAKDERDALSVVGDPVTVGGDLIVVAEDGALTLNGEPLLEASNPNAAAQVASVAVEADSAAWPDVTLKVKALDADGATVDGLGADAFRITDNGETESFFVRKNTAGVPRILFLLDRSSSLPAAFRDEAMVALASDLAQRIKTDLPDAEFRVGTAINGVSWAGAWTGELTALEAQLNTDSIGDSEFWIALEETAAESASLILLVTDAQQDPPRDPNANELQAIVSGPPVLAVGAGDVDREMLDRIASLSGGRSFLADDAESVVTEALGFLSDVSEISYEFVYRVNEADASAGTERRVSVAFDDERLSAEDNYAPPARPGRAPGLSGLYLTIRVGDKSLTRTIAGFDEEYSTNSVVSDATVAEARNALMGKITIGVEGASPPLSVRLADWYKGKLSLEAPFKALATGDENAIIDSFVNTYLPPAALTRLVFPPAQNDSALTFEANPQLTTVVERPVSETSLIRIVDLFPFSRRRSVAANDGAAWRAALADGAYRAIAEDAVFGEGTYSLLADETLAPLKSGDVGTVFAALPETDQRAWRKALRPYEQFNDYTILAPNDGTPLAFYAVHKQTGDLAAIMPDGSGGAREELEADLADTERIIDTIGVLNILPNSGVWVALEKTKARLVTRATIMLATGVTPDTFGETMENLAHDLAKEFLGPTIPGLGEIFTIEGYVGIVGAWTGVETPSI